MLDFLLIIWDILLSIPSRKDISETKDEIIEAYYSRKKDRNTKLAKAVGAAMALLIMSVISILLTVRF